MIPLSRSREHFDLACWVCLGLKDLDFAAFSVFHRLALPLSDKEVKFGMCRLNNEGFIISELADIGLFLFFAQGLIIYVRAHISNASWVEYDIT